MAAPNSNGPDVSRTRPAKSHSKTNPDCTVNSEAHATYFVAANAVFTGTARIFTSKVTVANGLDIDCILLLVQLFRGLI